MDVKVEEPGENNVHNNAFYAEEMLLKSEQQAMRDCNPLTARYWIVWHFYVPSIEHFSPSYAEQVAFSWTFGSEFKSHLA